MKASVPGLETNMEMRNGFGRCVVSEGEEQAGTVAANAFGAGTDKPDDPG